MGAIFSRQLSLVLLLSLASISYSWSLFGTLPSPSSGDPVQSLLDANVDSFEGGIPSGAGSNGNGDGNVFSSAEQVLPTYEPITQMVSNWHFFSLPFFTETLPAYFKAIILFKPPVGIVSVYVFLNLLFLRNKNLMKAFLSDDDVGQQQSTSARNGKKKFGRSLDLDEADGKLRKGLGGVEAVRTELCLAALEGEIRAPPPPRSETTMLKYASSNKQDFSQIYPTFDLSDPEMRSKYISAAKDALRVKVSSQASKEAYIENTLEPLSRLQAIFESYRNFDNQLYHRQGKRRVESDDLDILWMAVKVAEVRTLDAFLRVLRERLLTSAVRLSRKENYRAWRLQWYENGWGRDLKIWLRKITKGKTLEDDRVNLQLTSAALKREMERLGQVQLLLLSRPVELSEAQLLMASSVAGGKIDSLSAKMALKAAYRNYKDNSIPEYSLDAHNWTTKARALVNELVSETLTAAFQPNDKVDSDSKTTVEHDLQTLKNWATYYKNDLESWDTALSLTEKLSKARLMREQKYLPNAVDLKYLLKSIDVYGIPSSLTTIFGAFLFHNTFKPYWPDIVSSAKRLCETVWGVIEFRFWSPVKDIVLDLLNQRPKMLDPFALANEEMSLDNMLNDLGLSDGTKEKRASALARASRMYEEELAQGTIRNLFRGDMVRLLLIQLQQLKTSSLQSLGSIDDLMDANRLNVQLLTTIPAILLVTFGTRIFFRAMYSLRSREIIVGFGDAKVKMGDLLRKMERTLLLASHKEDVFDTFIEKSRKDEVEASSSTLVTLQPKELGEFILHMHSYLTILDYCSPPFPTKGCDAIHEGMQDLLMHGQLSTKRQIALLQLINVKHHELMKI